MPLKRTKAVARRNVQRDDSQREQARGKRWDGSDTRHYNKMKEVQVPPTRLACTWTMTELGIKDDIEGLFEAMGLGGLCRLKEPTYPDLVRQFLASAYTKPGHLTFIVNKVYFEIPYNELCDVFGLSAGERTTGLYWTNELLEFWKVIGTGVYGSPHSKESLIRNPVLRYATRLIGCILYGTTTSASVTQWELCFLFQGVRHLLPAFANSTYPTASAFNMGAMLAANLAGYKGKLTSSKGKVCGFGAVITRILKHVEFDFSNSELAVDKSSKSNLSNLDVESLINKEFLAGPFSKMPANNAYVYVFQDRARRPLYCRLPQVGLTSLISADAVEFLPPPTALIEKPSYFTPKYGSKGKAVEVEEEEEQEEGDIQAETEDDSQPRHLLSPDSSQYRLEDLPPNANPKQQQQWMRESIKTNNDMLHKMWAAISKIRPCHCTKDDVVQQGNATSSSSSGSSGTRRQRKKSKRPEATEGTSGAADAE